MASSSPTAGGDGEAAAGAGAAAAAPVPLTLDRCVHQLLQGGAGKKALVVHRLADRSEPNRIDRPTRSKSHVTLHTHMPKYTLSSHSESFQRRRTVAALRLPAKLCSRAMKALSDQVRV